MDPVSFEDGESAETPQGRSDSLKAVAGLCAVIAGLVAVFWLLSLTDDADSNAQRESRDSSRSERESASTTIRQTSQADSESDPGLSLNDAGEGLGETASAGAFSALNGRLTYMSRDGVVVVDLETGIITNLSMRILSAIPPIDDLRLLQDSRRTIGIPAPPEPLEALVIASNASVVRASTPLVDYWVVSQPDGPNGTTRLSAWQSYGFMWSGLTAPAGSQLVASSREGLLVVPPSGGTFLPTIQGFEPVSPHRTLAAGNRFRLEQRCDSQLACEIVIVDADSGRATEVPDELVTELADLSFSPDDRWLLNDTSPAWLFDRHDDTLHILEVGGYGGFQWSEDSRLLAWLTSDRTPALVVVRLPPSEPRLGEPAATGTTTRPEDRLAHHVVELAGVQAGPAPGSSFLLDLDFSADTSLGQR